MRSSHVRTMYHKRDSPDRPHELNFNLVFYAQMLDLFQSMCVFVYVFVRACVINEFAHL